MPMRRRTAAGWNAHVDETMATGSVFAGYEDFVCVGSSDCASVKFLAGSSAGIAAACSVPCSHHCGLNRRAYGAGAIEATCRLATSQSVTKLVYSGGVALRSSAARLRWPNAL
jgi:hypothetical protein